MHNYYLHHINTVFNKSHLICLLLLFSMVLPSRSYSRGGPHQDIVFTHYTTKHGISQNDINCIFQDSQGLIWIGTNDGFCSFDGYRFKVYRMDTHPLPSNLIFTINEDKNGNLWIGTTGAGIIRFNIKTETFTTFQNNKKFPNLFTANIVSKIVFDKDDNLWFYNGKGLNCILNSSLEKESIRVNKYYHNPHNSESILSNLLTDLALDSERNLWIGTNQGLQKFIPSPAPDNYGTFKTYRQVDSARPTNGVISICKYNDRLLISYYNGIFELTDDNKLVNKSSLKCDHIIYDKSGIIWAGTNRGVYRLRENGVNEDFEILGHYTNNIYESNSLSRDIIMALYEDNTGMIWIGTNGGGLNKFNPNKKKFRHIKRTPLKGSLSYNKIRAIYEDRKQNLWIGTEGGGVNLLEAGNMNYHTGFTPINVKVSDRGQNRVYAFQDWQDEIAMGMGYPLVGTLVNKDIAKNPEQIKDKKLTSIIKNAIFTLATEGDSIIWAGTYGKGLYRGIKRKGKETEWTKINDAPRQKKNNTPLEIVRNLLIDSKNNLWIGSNQGLYVIPASERLKDTPKMYIYKTQEDNPIAISHDYILPIYETSNGEVWVGTMGGGLNIVKNTKDVSQLSFEKITTSNGLPNNVIKSIVEDDYGNLWVASNQGLTKINLVTRRINNFDISDGLQDYEFGELAVCKRKNGEILVGGVNGINIFYPHEIVDDNTVGDVTFTELKVLNEVIAPMEELNGNKILSQSIRNTKEIKLPYNQSSFSLEFAYLHYASPDKNMYKYKLEGFDEGWIPANASKRIAKYTNLSPGEYTLKVKASNGDMVWNPEPKTLKIVITPPWWMTWWALLSYAVVLIALIWFSSQYSVITARKKDQLEMAKFEREKLEDLSQLKMQFFTNISHELRTPLTLIHTPIEQLIKKGDKFSDEERDKSYQMIFKNVQHLMRLVNQLMDFRKLEQGKMKLSVAKRNWTGFVDQAYCAFKELAAYENIDFVFNHSQQEIKGYLDSDKMEKILYNLLSNAFKFTQEGNITIDLKADADKVYITLTDTGIGIPKEKQRNLFTRFYQVSNLKRAKHRGTGIGLSFTKSLIELHHGSISFVSKEGEGTTFHLEFPLNDSAYEKENKIELAENLTMSHVEPEDVIEEDKAKKEDVLDSKPSRNKVLVVDDNASIREMLRDLLKDTYDVELAEDGLKGLSKAKEIMPDLVLSDVMMPQVDGYELVKRIRDDDQLCHLPIILLTAKNSKESKLKGYEYGADAYVSKPFNSDILLARIQSLIENRKNQQKRFRTNIDIQPSEITFTSIDERFLNRLVKIVEENISDSEFTVEKLALEYGATPLRLNQKLKALTGQTAKGFIRNIRLKRAAQMLKLGRFSVSDVTYEVGFNDLKYFRNCFKKEFGIPPSHYLKQEQEKEAEVEEEAKDNI